MELADSTFRITSNATLVISDAMILEYLEDSLDTNSMVCT